MKDGDTVVVSDYCIDCPCDIYRLNDNIVASAVVKTIAETGIVVSGTNMVEIEPKTLLKISIRPQDRQAEVYVGLVSDSTPQMLTIVSMQQFKDFNKREYFRLNVMINSKIQLCDQNGNATEEVIPVKVRDLSLTGIFFVAKNLVIEPGQQLQILLPLNDTYSYPCTVRRRVDYYRSIGYGCSFNELDNKQEDCLCNYLFEQQRKEIMRTKN